jgi:integrase
MRGHVRRRGRAWSFVVDVGRDAATGKRRQRWSSGYETKKAAEVALRKALHRVDVGDDPFPEKITLAEFVEARWLPHLKTQGKLRPSTRRRYEQLLRKHVLDSIGGLRLDRIRPAHCQAVLDALIDGGRAPRTVAHCRAAMSSAFQAALRWQLVSTNPVRATTTPTPERPKLTTPDAAQLRALAEAAVGTTWEIAVLLAATTGARRGEVLGLRWSDVDLDRGRVRIDEALQRMPDGTLGFTPPKTERARREIPLPAFAVERLRRHRADQAQRRLALGAGWQDLDLVCERGDGAPLDPSSFTHGFTRIAKAFGMEGVRLHDLRHGVATALAKAGTPAYVTSKVLGHSSVHFTANTYTHADDETVDRALAGLEQAFAQ